MSRAEYLSSSFDSSINKYDGNIQVQENHKWIYSELAKSFIPADAYNKDVLKIATDKNLNLCFDKTIIIFTNGINKEEINSLKFHLYMNFITNWRPYDKYIRTFVENTKVTFDTVTIDDFLDSRFNDDSEQYNNINNTDVLFIHMTKPIQRVDVYRETAKNLIESRDSRGLVSVIIYLGTETDYIGEGYESKMIGVSPKRFYFNSSPSMIKQTKKSKTKQTENINEEEMFGYDKR